MQRCMQLWLVSALALVLQCAAQGGGNTGKAKSTYAHSRSFDQWEHALNQDPLILVAFITAVVSGESVIGLRYVNIACTCAQAMASLPSNSAHSAVPGFLLVMWPLVYDYLYAAAVSCKICSKQPLSVPTLQRSSSEFFIRSNKQ